MGDHDADDGEPKESAVKTVGDALRALLERIGEFFDLFDLSFLVSGATATAALTFLYHRRGHDVPGSLLGWPHILGVIVACYVFGLICFAVGRWARHVVRPQGTAPGFKRRLREVLEDHGLVTDEPIAAYLGRRDGAVWRLYVRLWAEVRMSPAVAPSLSLLKRYWVMAATYDGMATSLVIWIGVIASTAFGWSAHGRYPIHLGEACVTIAVLAVGALACWREANRYLVYQVEEIVATIAHAREQRRN